MCQVQSPPPPPTPPSPLYLTSGIALESPGFFYMKTILEPTLWALGTFIPTSLIIVISHLMDKQLYFFLLKWKSWVHTNPTNSSCGPQFFVFFLHFSFLLMERVKVHSRFRKEPEVLRKRKWTKRREKGAGGSWGLVLSCTRPVLLFLKFLSVFKFFLPLSCIFFLPCPKFLNNNIVTSSAIL